MTTQTLFARWLHAHKDWWDKGVPNVPQQIGAALKNETFYTQAISTKMVAKCTQGGDSIDKAIAWAASELQGFMRV